MVKKFKSFVKEEDLKDFEEDVLGETPPNTADAMKRFNCLLYTSDAADE